MKNTYILKEAQKNLLSFFFFRLWYWICLCNKKFSWRLLNILKDINLLDIKTFFFLFVGVVGNFVVFIPVVDISK